MSEIKPSKADVLKEWIRNSISNKQSSELDISGRSKDRQELRTSNPEFQFTDSHYQLLFKKEIIRQKGKAALIDYGLNPDVVKTKMQKSNSSIGGATQTVPKNVQTKIQNGQQQQQQNQTQSKDNDGKFHPITAAGAQNNNNQQLVANQINQVTMKFNERNVGAVIKAVYGGIKFFYPDLEGLTDEEKTDLGDLFLPMFENYFQNNYATVVIPILAGAAIVAPKVKRAKKVKDAKKKDDSLASLEKQKKKLDEQISKKKVAKELKDKK